MFGSLASLISWRNTRKARRQYGYLLDLADLNIDKGVTEQEIAEKRMKATKLADRIGDLQEQITHEIPIEAKRAVLRDRFDASLASLSHAYQDLLRTKNELSGIGSEREIPQELRRAVQGELQPRYLQKERISSIKTALTLLSASAAASSTLLPYPAGRFIGGGLIVLSLPVIVYLVRLSFSRRVIARWTPVVSAVAGSFITAFAGLILGVQAAEVRYGNENPYLLGSLAAAITTIGLLAWAIARARRIRGTTPPREDNAP